MIALIGRTFPDSSRTDDPDPARICRENVVEQKNGSSTDLRMAWICFLSVVSKCFLDGDRLVGFFSRRFWLNTTAGILPWALSFTEILLPVHSLGMAWIVWYKKARENSWGGQTDDRKPGLSTTVLRPRAPERHHFAISGCLSANLKLKEESKLLLFLYEGFVVLGFKPLGLTPLMWSLVHFLMAHKQYNWATFSADQQMSLTVYKIYNRMILNLPNLLIKLYIYILFY